MANTEFMKKKYALDSLVTQYLEAIKGLKSSVQTPADETKLQMYFQAVSTFKRVSIKDIVQFALSYGRSVTGKSAQMKEAFPTLLGNRITQPSTIDIAYLQLLLEYTKAFKHYRGNLKEWMLKFLISSRFSPLFGFVEREIDGVIEHTQRKIREYSARF